MAQFDHISRTAGLEASGWEDRLVELHVLTEIGDRAAAAAAAAWMAHDDRARSMWDRVEQVCGWIREHPDVPADNVAR